MSKLLVFDLETQYTADEVGGWGRIRDMRLAVGATLDPHEGRYRIYGEEDIDQLVEDLHGAERIVGYNVRRFDYEVLRAYTDRPLDALPTVDMLVDLHRSLGWRPKLDDLALATLGEGKSGNGLDAVRWFRQGRLEEVVAYCKRDVDVTWRVYDFGRRSGYVQVRDRSWRIRRIPVPW